METEIQTIFEQVSVFWTWIQTSFRNLLLPSRLIQIGILLGLFALSYVLAKWVGPKLYHWMRGLEGRPKWQLRALLVLYQRLQLIFFVILAWGAAGVMAQVYIFPSRRYILVLIATIATALLLAGFATRLVHNKFLRRNLRWGLWIYITLYYLGLIDNTSALLDSIAIELGDFRLSALAIVKALIITGVLFTLARVVSGSTARQIRKNEEISPSMRVLAVKMLQVTLYGSAFFIGLKAVVFDLTGLAFLSGAIGVGLGFGLQKVVSNLVSGVIILLDKSVKPGDVISHVPARCYRGRAPDYPMRSITSG